MAGGPEGVFSLELDHRLVVGLITDRDATLEEFESLGIVRAVALRRAQSLGLTKERMRSLKGQPDQVKVRPCLGCEERFLSQGAHNRFCDPCRKKGEGRVRS